MDTTNLMTMFHPAHPPRLLCPSCCSDQNIGCFAVQL